jgi:hypothetical protein
MLGFLIDADEFEVKPAISRLLLLNEFMAIKNFQKKFINTSIDIKTVVISADGTQTVFSVGEKITQLFLVSVNGLVQRPNIDYFWLGQTSRVTLVNAPTSGSKIMISYYAGRSNVFQDAYGNLLFFENKNFTYNGSDLTFDVGDIIVSMIYVTANGLVQEEDIGYTFSGSIVTLIDSQHQLIYDDSIIIAYLR